MPPVPASQPLPPGFCLEQYRIERQIACGGFSIVYLAYDADQMPVAIKEFLPHALARRSAGGPEPEIDAASRAAFNDGLKCFFEEGRALALLDHPNVVRVSDFFRANGTAYLVMAYERGRTLREHVQHRGSALAETFLRGLFARLLSGLREVHEHKLLHLDIKPANIFLRSDGWPLLLDFGAARQTIGRDHLRLPLAIHTPGYAAPEQYGGHEHLGPWTDIYGIGASLYYCLAGASPGAADQRLQQDVLPAAARRWKGRYSPDLLHAIDACMQLDAHRRPQSVFELQRTLSQVPHGALDSGGLFGGLRSRLERFFAK